MILGNAVLIAIACLAAGYGGATLVGLRRVKKVERAREKSLKQAVQLQIENEALKHDVQRYSNIINLSYNPIWLRDDSLKIIYCNLAFAEVAEETTEKVVELGDLELYKGHRNLAEKAWDTGQEQSISRHIIVNGERRLYRIRELPSYQDGTVTGYATDITEQEQAQEEVERHVSAQRDLLESSTSAMAIYGKDMRLKFYNFAFVSLWKLDEEWLDTEPTYGEMLEMLREKRRLPEQANFPQFKQQHLKMFTDLIEPEEEFFYLPDGKILRVIAIPHALGGVLFAYEDVTDRLALERSYNTLIAVQRETLDNLHEGVVVFGENGRLRLCNPVFLSLWKLDEEEAQAEPHINDILEKTQKLFLTEDWNAFRTQFVAQIQSRTHVASRLERSDGKVLDWTSVPLPDGASLLTFIDVTDSTLVERSLREKNEALEAADHLKTEFLANVSYELRSPLTSISGFADMLHQQIFGELNDKQQEYIEGIQLSSQHLSQLINNVLDLASIEAGYLKLEVSSFDVNEMLRSTLMLIAERTRELEMEITEAWDADIGEMVADEARIKQVIFNLLTNAVKYSKGGNITVGARADENDKIIFWVEDNGVGIDPSVQARVFDQFYRGGAVTGQQSGTGLGLSMVKSFVELHNGYVELESEPNKGTKVLCVLPRKAKGIKNVA